MHAHGEFGTKEQTRLDDASIATSPAVLLISISSLFSLVLTVALCSCCCKKKVSKEEQDDQYSEVEYRVGDKNRNGIVITGREAHRVAGAEKDASVGRPLLPSVDGVVQSGMGGAGNPKNTVFRALPSLPSVPPRPLYPENNVHRTAAQVHSSKVDPNYERVEGAYSVVDSEDPYSSIRSDIVKDRIHTREGGKREEIYQLESSATSSSGDYTLTYPKYAKIHKKRSSEPNMLGILTEEGVPIVPNRLEDELAVDYLYAKVRRRHSDTCSDFTKERIIRGVEGQSEGNAVVVSGENVISGSVAPGSNVSQHPVRPSGARLLLGPPAGLKNRENNGMVFDVQQQSPASIIPGVGGGGGIRGSAGGSTNSGREPSYKYITVRESVETLRDHP